MGSFESIVGIVVCLRGCGEHHDRYERDTMILRKKAFNWGLLSSFRGLVHDHHGVKQTTMTL